MIRACRGVALVMLLLVTACSRTGGLGVSGNGPYAPSGVDTSRQAVDGLTVGHRLMAAGEYELALKAYYRAGAVHGLNVDVLSALGSANLKLGRLGQAEKLLRRAVAKDEALRTGLEQPWRGADGAGQSGRGRACLPYRIRTG